MKAQLNLHFIKHILVTDLFIFLFLIFYNILGLILPFIKVRLAIMVLLLLIIDICLISIKVISLKQEVQ